MYKIKWTQEKIDEAISILTKYFAMYGPGEVIMQSDKAIIDAPEILSQIADNVLKEGEGINYIDDWNEK